MAQYPPDPELPLSVGYLEQVLRERLVGRRIKKVLHEDEGYSTATGHPLRGSVMHLDDGHVLRLYCSDQDCCAYAGGDWVINADNLDAMITDVRAEILPESGDDGDGTTNYVKIIVLHNQNPIAQADCSANDGNGGYYYSCLSLDISHLIGTSQHDITLKVVDA